jgi:hypothetical protein
MSCFCGCARRAHFHDGRCTECNRCFQFESSDGTPEDMGRVQVVERRAVEVVRREPGVWSSAPRGDE